MIDIRAIEATSNPDAFKTSIDLKAMPKFNQHGDNIDPIIRGIPIHNIDEYAFNPRQADNDHFEAIKESIQKVGLQQRFSVVRNPETKRYTLIKGGNTRLLVFKELYRETGDIKFSVIDCIVEPWNGELNRTQAVIAHLIENEARGELILVDKAKALIELEREYKNKGIESLRSPQTKSGNANISTTTQEFVEYLKDNGYSVGETQLSLFRFTAIKLVGNLDRFLNQGLGSPQIIKIRAVYNNLKRIIKDAGIEDYSNESLDHDFFDGLKKYNKTRNPFDFDRLLDFVVMTNVAHSPFVSLFKNNTEDFRKELLSTRKPKPKVQPKKDGNNLDTDDVKDDVKSKEAVIEALQDPQASKDQELDDGVIADPKDTEAFKDTEALDGAGIAEPNDPKDVKALNGADIADPLSPQDEYESETDNIETDQGIKNPNPNPLEDENNTLNTKHNTNLNPEGHATVRLDFYRKQAINLATKITNKLNIGKTIEQIDTGCGFLLVDLINESKNDFEHWGVWWLLLGYSHAADCLNPISDLRLLSLVNVDLNQELSALYESTNLVDVDAVDTSLITINQRSELYEFRSPNLQSVKDKLVPHLWQDITELEAVCYQIMRIVRTGEEALWH